LSVERFAEGLDEKLRADDGKVLSRSVLEFVWRGLRLDKDIGSGSEVNRLVSELLG